jgi:hypothetical protein
MWVQTETQKEFNILLNELNLKTLFIWDNYEKNTCIQVHTNSVKSILNINKNEVIISLSSYLLNTAERIYHSEVCIKRLASDEFIFLNKTPVFHLNKNN